MPQGMRQLADGRFILTWSQGDRETLIPILPLTALFRYPAERAPASTSAVPISASPVLLVRISGGLYGISVDRVLDERELVVRPLETAIAAPPYIYGCCLLSDNRLALAIDIQTLLIHETQSASRSPQPPNHAHELLPPASKGSIPTLTHSSPRQIKVMVVEDSAPFRQMLSVTLQGAGYQVSEAGDGVEAIAKLQQNKVDLIISDIEMPRMTGFELLTRLRLEPSLAKIPTIMLTSRASDKYRQMAEGLGAKAFLTKPYSERELLNITNDLVTLLP
jgi:two-component system, chemotaxis family, sensor histidine kinase and response regulator PixL